MQIPIIPTISRKNIIFLLFSIFSLPTMLLSNETFEQNLLSLENSSILLVNIISGSLGGTATHNLALYEKLKELNLNVDCLVGSNTPVREVMKKRGLHYFEAAGSSEEKILEAFDSILRDNSFDLIHCTQPTEAYCAKIAAKPYGIKVILQNHSFLHLEKRNKYYSYTARELRGLDGLITINSAQEEIIKRENKQKNLGIGLIDRIPSFYPEDKFQNLKPALNPKAYLEKKLSIKLKNGPVITIVGSVNKNKNQKLAIEAVSILKHTKKISVNLLIVGNIPKYMANVISGAIKNCNVRDCVHCIGHRHDVSDIVCNSDINISTSLAETLSLVLLEGGVLKMPSICAKIPGPTDFILHGKTGLTFSKNNAAELANAIEYYVQNPQDAKAYGQSLFDRVKENYSIPILTKKLIAFYTKVIGN